MLSRMTFFKAHLQTSLQGSDQEILDLCRQEHEGLRQRFTSLATLKNNYTAYRNLCRELIPEPLLPMCLAIFNLTLQEIRLFRKTYQKTIANEHRNLRPLHNVNGLINKAVQLLTAVSVYDRILGLAALTGRRVAELACTAHMVPLGPDKMLFDGQIKTKNKKSSAYVIPVLADPGLIEGVVRNLRAQKPEWQEQMVLFNNTGSRHLSVRVKQHFSDHIEHPTAKDLRAVYAEICYARFAPLQIVKTRYISDILGHGLVDNTTGQSYLDFYIVPSESDHHV